MNKLNYLRNRRDLLFLEAEAYLANMQIQKARKILAESLNVCDLIHHLSCREGAPDPEDLEMLYKIGTEAVSMILLEERKGSDILAALVSIMENLEEKGMTLPGSARIYGTYARILENGKSRRAAHYYRKAISCLNEIQSDPSELYLGYLRTTPCWEPEYALMFEPCYQAIEYYSMNPYDNFSEFYFLRSRFFVEFGNLQRALQDIQASIRLFRLGFSSLVHCSKKDLIHLVSLYELKDEIEGRLKKEQGGFKFPKTSHR